MSGSTSPSTGLTGESAVQLARYLLGIFSPAVYDCHTSQTGEITMAKSDQKSNKMAKKPKKDVSPPKPGGPSDRPMPPQTTVLPKGKEKYK